MTDKRTAKQAAKDAGVSERQLFKGAEILRRGRHDLFDKVMAKKMSMHAAWLEARGEPKPTSWDRLVTAWNNATEEERARLIEQATGDRSLSDYVRSHTAICLPDRSGGTANLQSED